MGRNPLTLVRGFVRGVWGNNVDGEIEITAYIVARVCSQLGSVEIHGTTVAEIVRLTLLEYLLLKDNDK